MPKLNLLVVTNLYPSTSGHYESERVTHALRTIFAGMTDRCRILVLKPVAAGEQEKKEIVDDIEVNCLHIPRVPRTVFYITTKIQRLFREKQFRPDAAIGHMYTGAFIARRVSSRYRIPFIYGIHGSDVLHVQTHSRLGRRIRSCLKDANLLAIRSWALAHQLLGKWEHCPPYFIAFSGIEAGIIVQDELGHNKVKQATDSREITFVTVSLLQKLKNIDSTMRALAEANHVFDWRYIIVGDGEERNHLEKLSEELGINDRTIFLGYQKREKVLSILETTDVFIMVSAPETFGLAYLEAMAKANIVIGAKGWGIAGVVEHERNGFLCEAGETAELRKTIENIEMRYIDNTIQPMIDASISTAHEMTNKRASENYFEHIAVFLKGAPQRDG